jgi:hypothetical protein
MLEGYQTVLKNFMNALTGKKEVVPKEVSENELCENENNQGETVQLPCRE